MTVNFWGEQPYGKWELLIINGRDDMTTLVLLLSTNFIHNESVIVAVDLISLNIDIWRRRMLLTNCFFQNTSHEVEEVQVDLLGFRRCDRYPRRVLP